ncbi:MAG: hypothetical protein QM661_05725 [Solimonas sp.]
MEAAAAEAFRGRGEDLLAALFVAAGAAGFIDCAGHRTILTDLVVGCAAVHHKIE